MRRLFAILFACLFALLMLVPSAFAGEKTITVLAADYPVEENGCYSSMEEVAVYIALYGKLPRNFLTKNQAEALGWDNRLGNLGEVAPGCSIGGNRFGNYEGVLPDKSGRKWTECDINSDGGYRNAERICFSSDGLIYYSNDHYTTFTQIEVSFEASPAENKTEASVKVKKGKAYVAKDEVAAYLHQFHELPSNYLTKSEAKKLGWTNKKDNLGQLSPGSAIGGDEYQNREGLLPKEKGRTWYECDVNVSDGKRSKERLCYSTDGLIYYTPDAYKNFVQLY
jgi:Guanyl-specific ribonuclease Sa